MSKIDNPIHIVLTWEADNWGGVDYLVQSLIYYWPLESVNFTLITNRNNPGFDRLRSLFTGNKKINIVLCSPFYIINLRLFFLFRFILLPIFFIISIFKYYLILRKLNADVIIAINGGYPASYGVLSSTISAYFLKIPVRTLVICHAAIKSQLLLFNFSKLLDLILSKILSSVIFISDATKRSVAVNTSLLDSEILNAVVIHMGVSNSLSYSNELINKATDKFNHFRCNKSIKLVGVVGRIQPYKGHEDLIYSLSLLPRSARNALQLVFIGTGKSDYIKKLKIMIKNLGLEQSIHFMGYVDIPTSLIYGQLDLLIMCTRTFEGFGLTIPEAMIVGTPVLATNVGAVKEFTGSNYISLIEPGRTDQIASELIDFCENTAKWKTRSAFGVKYIAENFSTTIMLNRYYNHILQLYSLSKE